LAQWIVTVQNRVAPFTGLMTLEHCDLDGLESLMILENEDRKLLCKVRDMLRTAESKVSMERPRTDHPFVFGSGLGPTVLRVSAYLLEQAVVWPGKSLFVFVLFRGNAVAEYFSYPSYGPSSPCTGRPHGLSHKRRFASSNLNNALQISSIYHHPFMATSL
jgi:hypothetical protein